MGVGAGVRVWVCVRGSVCGSACVVVGVACVWVLVDMGVRANGGACAGVRA